VAGGAEWSVLSVASVDIENLLVRLAAMEARVASLDVVGKV